MPTIQEIQLHLNKSGLLRLTGANIELVAARNHHIYRVTSGRRIYALRMINSESYRRSEWITMAEEYMILKAIESAGLGPKAHALDEGFVPPFLIQEFVEAACYNDLKPLTEEHLVAAARAIAVLNAMDLNPEQLPFLSKYVRRDYAGSGVVWYYRLADAIRRMPRRDVLRWALKILPLIPRTMAVLARSAPLLSQDFSFHFDGAHTGNTYWRDERVMFLDWQKVSLRNDPTFTLVRFATSVGHKGEVPEGAWEKLISAYLAIRPLQNFPELALVRLIERQTADLVWSLWDAARRRDPRSVEPSVALRYVGVQAMQEIMRGYR